MRDVLAIASSSHPIEIETFESALGTGYAVSELELRSGTLHVSADEAISAALEGKEAVFLRTGEITETVIESADDLQMIAVHGSGYDHVDVESATRSGVVVTHNPEGPGPAVVEHTISTMILLLREFPERFERTAAGEWSREPALELGQRTIGVVGLGYIGSRVAEIVAGSFGAEVIGYDPYVTGELESEVWPRRKREEIERAGVDFVGWDDLFERADLVTLHTPLTERTEEMVGEPELEALAGGYLINTSRGGVIDEDALLDALERRTLERVALDVRPEEPPGADDPLLGHPRVYATPHVAGVGDGYPTRAARAAAEKIRTVLSGGRPDTVVNSEVYDVDGDTDRTRY